ncbi:hypothetical protein SLS61_010271, partial [Didymella pomorum]
QAPLIPEPINVVNTDGETSTEWYVDEFIDCKKRKGTWQYLVKWQGDPKATWEPAEGLLQHYDARLYHYLHPDKTKPDGFRMLANWRPRTEDLQDRASEGEDSESDNA